MQTQVATTSTTVTATWVVTTRRRMQEPPAAALVGATPKPYPPSLSGGAALDLPHESARVYAV